MIKETPFARVLLADGVPEHLIFGERIALRSELFDDRGRLRVPEAIKEVARTLPDSRPLLIVTGCDLNLPGCGALFGFADRSRNVAVVSIFRLAHPRLEVLERRLDNEIAHEWAHLEGWLHCNTRGCLMNAVTGAVELDSRPAARCGRCPRVRFVPRARRLTAACLFFAAAIAAGDSIPRLAFLPQFQAPFS